MTPAGLPRDLDEARRAGGPRWPADAVARVRDLLVTRHGGTVTVVACDSNAGIGDQPGDIIRQPARVTGTSAAKVPLMEVLAAGAAPVIVVNTLGCALDGPGAEIVAGIEDCVRSTGHHPVITGSDETNVATGQTSVGVTVIGVVDEASLRLGLAREGDLVAVVGVPMDGVEVPYDESDALVVTPRDVVALAARPDVAREILPVGSRGVRHEAGALARTAGLAFDEVGSSVAMTRSAGSSTCVLVACDPGRLDELATLVAQPVTVVGRLVAVVAQPPNARTAASG